jgi:hypothetical protein
MDAPGMGGPDDVPPPQEIVQPPAVPPAPLPEAPAVPATEPDTGPGALARIPGVFFMPVRTFESIARRPTWLAPLLLWTAVSIAVTSILIPRIDFDRMMRARLERGGQTVPEDRIQAAVAMQKRLAPILYNAIAFVTPAVFSLLVAAVFWGSFKSFGWDMSFKQGFGVTTHAFLPGVLGSLIFIPVLLRQQAADPTTLGDLLRSNLGFLVDRKHAVLHALMQSVDIFSFWTLALLIVGFAASARVSRKSAAAIVIVVWVLFVIGKAGFAGIFGG